MKKEEFLTSALCLGKLPWAPRVWAALPPVVIYQVLGYLWPAANPYVMVVFLLAGSSVTVAYAPLVISTVGLKESRQVVTDVFAGQSLTMLLITVLSPLEICNSMAIGFILFLMFDYIMPWPCKRLRNILPEGFDILADDLTAGLYAGILATVLIRSFPVYFGTCRW